MIEINNIYWQIKMVPQYNPVLMTSDGDYTYGVCDNYTKTIYLSEDLTGNFLKRVLCHELTHAAMFSYGVDLTVDQEELIADLLATYGEEVVYITNKIFKKITGEG